MSLDKYCNACEAFPAMGYCGLAGCPNVPATSNDPPMDFERCFERLVQWAMAYAAECEEDGVKGVIGAVNRDQLFCRRELEYSEAMGCFVSGGGSLGDQPPRPDLALGACQVAARTDQLDVAKVFAQTAIDFMTGNYEPLEEGQ